MREEERRANGVWEGGIGMFVASKVWQRFTAKQGFLLTPTYKAVPRQVKSGIIISTISFNKNQFQQQILFVLFFLFFLFFLFLSLNMLSKIKMYIC